MRKIIFLLIFTLCSISMVWATSMPTINGRLRVCSQNCKYYYVLNYVSSSMTDYHTYDELMAKTNKMVSSFCTIDADIYALCEVEQNDSVLGFLTAAMNKKVGYTKYAYVKDGIAPYNGIKGGFVYNCTTVAPYGSNQVGTTEKNTAYKMRNRLQAFTELATGERFVLSVNHFKSKRDDTNSGTEDDRIANANGVLERLSLSSIRATDPDQLVVGDLNETTSEEAIQLLVKAGYEEQLERFCTAPYSYRFGTNQLIDHILANASMAAQVVDADVYHINTDNNRGQDKTYYNYSDHDPVICGINLGSENSDPETKSCEAVDAQLDLTDNLGGMQSVATIGSLEWRSNSTYGANINGYQTAGELESYLVSPEYDLSGSVSAEISFNHNIYYNNAGDDPVTGEAYYKQYQTLVVTDNYTGDPVTTEWTCLEIPAYAIKKYVTTRVNVPDRFLSSNFRFAFRYYAPEGGSTANYWEIKSASLFSKCPTGVALDLVEDEFVTLDGAESIYSITGQDITSSRYSLPTGIYILRSGNRVTKITVR